MRNTLALSSLATVRRRRGYTLLLAALASLIAIDTLIVLQAPLALRDGAITLGLILAVITGGCGALALPWTWLVSWPRERQRLASAVPIHALSQLPPTVRPLQPVAPLLLAGVVVAALLWFIISSVGFIGAPLLWTIAGAIDLASARLLSNTERQRGVVFYARVADNPSTRNTAQLFALSVAPSERPGRPH